ncbi:WXG100 family type VII secretion target [Nocardia rosealba]|uniref:WXG100 family type VII secretion target n=1 Tax=Nocardia rosealba TaxID=2878563 RepID=UPI001CD98712|nr:WXG100 family type VII secretion target [Nocardia rosealba]MCA2210302.1 WXG100 family type VII secretion target [Nocardia rosealba]
MAAFSYNLDDLANFSTSLDAFLRAVTDELSGAKSAVDELRAGGFSGAAAEAFDQVHTTWQTNGARLVAQLGDYRLKIDNAHHNYTQARQVNAEILGRPAI